MFRTPSRSAVIVVLVCVTVLFVFLVQDRVKFMPTNFAALPQQLKLVSPSQTRLNLLRGAVVSQNQTRWKLSTGSSGFGSTKLGSELYENSQTRGAFMNFSPRTHGPTTYHPATIAPASTAGLTAGCNIPHFDPFSQDVMKFVKRLGAHNCTREPQLVFVEGANITVNTALLDKRKETLVNCTYETITRAAENSVAYSKPVVFISTARPQADFVRAQCWTKDKSSKHETRYKALLPIITEKPDLEAVLDKRTETRKTPSETKRPPMNVVMIGIDTVSRFAMLRQLTATRHFLSKHLKAVDLASYNKVGLNTFPNILALTSGRAYSFNTRNSFKSRPVDTLNISFLWNEFASQGYRTLFCEDYPEITTFNYLKKGFKDPPAHYYIRTLEVAKNRNNDLYSEGRHCYGTWPQDELLLNYTLQFQRVFQNKPHFAFTFLTRSTHDNENGPSRVDSYHSRYLRTAHEEGLLSNTLLLVYSDHGSRWGKIRNTKQGEYEDNRPFAFLAFPPWFREEHPDVLRRVQMNAVRLVTPFDVHATLRDVLHLHLKDFRRERAKYNASGVGISLFDEIPANRTCADAGIPLLFCVCLKDRLLNTSSLLAKQAGTALVTELNTAMANLSDVCHVLHLKNVTSAVEIEQGWQYVAKHCRKFSEKLTDALLLRLAIFTKPGNGKFEAMTYRCNSTQKMFPYSDIDRTNEYGNTSHCVNDVYAKRICFCKV